MTEIRNVVSRVSGDVSGSQAWTYVATAFYAILNLVYYIFLVSRRN